MSTSNYGGGNFSLTEVRCKGSSGVQKTYKMVLSGGPASAAQNGLRSCSGRVRVVKTLISDE